MSKTENRPVDAFTVLKTNKRSKPCDRKMLETYSSQLNLNWLFGRQRGDGGIDGLCFGTQTMIDVRGWARVWLLLLTCY